jgi:hypothetical protein
MPRPIFKSKTFAVGLILTVLALTVVIWMGCGRSPSGPATQETVVFSAANPQIQAVIAVQDHYTSNLMAHSEVVGTGAGLTEDGKPAVVVFTKSDIKPRTDIRIESLAKGVAPAAIPATIQEVPVVIAVSGEVKALKGGSTVDPTARFDRPVPIGVSTGHFNITAGTIGCRVKKGGNVYALSNNHVYADENRASIGDNVLQPGPFDGGINPDDAIGTLSEFVTIKFDGSDNVVDAAIALSSTSLLGNATPSNGYGTPQSTTTTASVNMKVKKYGRTTSLTSSKVFAINVTVNVQYDQGVARFVNQVAISGGSFSQPGDSGSLIVVNGGSNDRKPVALLFAGGSGFTFANPIDDVLAAFGVTVDGQ